MPSVQFEKEINASAKDVWELLLDKVETPQRYIEQVKSSVVLERYYDGVLRQMELPTGVIKEKITINEKPKEIRFTMVDNPSSSSEIINKIGFSSDGLIVLSFSSEWEDFNATDESQKTRTNQIMLQEAVEHIKRLAESQKAG